MRNHNKKFKNLQGIRFGKLVVLEQCGFKGYHRQWLCQCDCGKQHKTLATNLLSRKIKSCGCIVRERGNRNIKWKGYGEISGRYFTILKWRAKKENRQITFSIQDLWALFLNQNRRCKLSGIELKFCTHWNDRTTQTASLDRIDSNKGYCLNNIQWVHKDINYMKQEFPQDKFIEWCKLVASQN